MFDKVRVCFSLFFYYKDGLKLTFVNSKSMDDKNFVWCFYCIFQREKQPHKYIFFVDKNTHNKLMSSLTLLAGLFHVILIINSSIFEKNYFCRKWIIKNINFKLTKTSSHMWRSSLNLTSRMPYLLNVNNMLIHSWSCNRIFIVVLSMLAGSRAWKKNCRGKWRKNEIPWKKNLKKILKQSIKQYWTIEN